MRRGGVAQVIADLIGFGKVVASSIGASGSLELQQQANEDDASEPASDEVWGQAPLLFKPAEATSAGHCETLYVELNNERVVIGTKERRWQAVCADGEVILRAMGPASPAYVKLKPDGTAEIHATAINLGGSATNLVALSNLVEDAISAAIAGHTHTGVTTGAGSSGNGVLAGSVASTAASKTRAE